jgi:hypothetical protein
MSNITMRITSEGSAAGGVDTCGRGAQLSSGTWRGRDAQLQHGQQVREHFDNGLGGQALHCGVEQGGCHLATPLAFVRKALQHLCREAPVGPNVSWRTDPIRSPTPRTSLWHCMKLFSSIALVNAALWACHAEW